MLTDQWRTATASGINGCVAARWHKADASTVNGNCAEVALCAHGAQVRDSKLGEDSPVLTFTAAEWAAFLDGVRKGEFDLPER